MSSLSHIQSQRGLSNNVEGMGVVVVVVKVVVTVTSSTNTSIFVSVGSVGSAPAVTVVVTVVTGVVVTWVVVVTIVPGVGPGVGLVVESGPIIGSPSVDDVVVPRGVVDGVSSVSVVTDEKVVMTGGEGEGGETTGAGVGVMLLS